MFDSGFEAERTGRGVVHYKFLTAQDSLFRLGSFYDLEAFSCVESVSSSSIT